MNLGIIGYGKRIRSFMKSIKEVDPSFRIKAVVDIGKDKISSASGKEGEELQFYETPEEMLSSEKLSGILIGTRCSLHTEMALKVMSSGVPLFLEKPVATTMEDLRRLQDGGETTKSKVVVSFPLRLTSLVQQVKEIVQSGRIGTVEHAQAINNVPYGGVYYHDWFRDENETGGMFLQKATHDFDYINYVLGLRPTQVCAMTSKQIFKGTKPSGLKCINCDDNRTCPESLIHGPDKNSGWEYCSFAEDTGNEDSGSALIRYETGMHLSYSQNFFVRRQAGARGARFMGYKGTVEFDFFSGEVKVIMHHSPKVELYKFEEEDDHFGGDTALARNFIGIMRGEEESVSPLIAGMDSALLCLKAKESAQTGTFQVIKW